MHERDKTDGWTDTGPQQRPHLRIASHDKKQAYIWHISVMLQQSPITSDTNQYTSHHSSINDIVPYYYYYHVGDLKWEKLHAQQFIYLILPSPYSNFCCPRVLQVSDIPEFLTDPGYEIYCHSFCYNLYIKSMHYITIFPIYPVSQKRRPLLFLW